MFPAARSPLSVMRTTAPYVAFLVAAAILLRFPPEHYCFYPRCPFYTLLHFQCPGCGGTRALAALLHGDLREALRLNALITLGLPIPLFARRGFWTSRSEPAIYGALAIAAIFTIARNL